ncbi:MAG: hypothetical protein ABL995_11435 [Bryobacteraceae bacterium]
MSEPDVSTSAASSPHIERKIKWASALIGAGLFVQLGSFLWVHPISFVLFLVVGCPLVGLGVLLYLLSLLD